MHLFVWLKIIEVKINASHMLQKFLFKLYLKYQGGRFCVTLHILFLFHDKQLLEQFCHIKRFEILYLHHISQTCSLFYFT